MTKDIIFILIAIGVISSPAILGVLGIILAALFIKICDFFNWMFKC